ncbi:MAG: hypothetical protein AAGE52_19370 [Myxococcota bacterium]
MIRAALLILVALVLPNVADAQYVHQPVRQPTRYLLVPPAQPPIQPVVVHRPVVVQPPQRVIVQRRVVVHPVEVEPEPEVHWFVGAGAGALLRFDAGREATPSYQLAFGVGVGKAEFSLRFDLAPGFESETEEASLYTAGAGFGYRFLDGRIHPVVGVGLESLFYNPEGGETSRAFAATGRLGVDLDVPTRFGALAVGLDVTAHQPLAGAEQANATLLGIGAHLAFRMR